MSFRNHGHADVGQGQQAALVASQVDGLLICHSRETEKFDHMSSTTCRDIPIGHFDRVYD